MHLLPVNVVCGDDEFSFEMHLDAVRAWASIKGYEAPYLITTSEDVEPERVASCLAWSKAPTLRLLLPFTQIDGPDGRQIVYAGIDPHTGDFTREVYDRFAAC